MVRASKAPGNEDFLKLASHLRHTVLVGSGIFRVLRPSAGKQDRVQRQRRAILPHAAESDTGGHLPHRLHCNSDADVQGTGAPVEPSRSLHLPDSGRVLRIPEITRRYGGRKIFSRFVKKIWRQ